MNYLVIPKGKTNNDILQAKTMHQLFGFINQERILHKQYAFFIIRAALNDV